MGNADYKGYTIILQSHPKLDKYEITKEDHNKELVHISTASTITQAKDYINNI